MTLTKDYVFTVEENISKIRVDKYLSSKIEDLSRSALSANDSEILINGVVSKKSDVVQSGDTVTLHHIAVLATTVEPEDIPLNIIYEDKDILVINKEQGLVVHPGAGNPSGTVVNALSYRYGESFIKEMMEECDITRPGLVHRLDKETSGVMVIALNARSLASLSAQFQNRETKKSYFALADGFFQEREGYIEGLIARDKYDRKKFCMSEIAGKESKSFYSVEKQFNGYALVRVRIFTGRTHQIRLHLKSIGHPVLGDDMYNRRPYRFGKCTLMLHSYSLEFQHPVSGERMKFTAPLPKRFNGFIDG